MHSIDSSFSNRLGSEKSPYLLQHAHNPVDWHPWGEEAFALARALDRPIFLSIGYSTCHWCHVMAHESFENADVAALMNDTFVNIKVDREERPDIDAVYMTACQMMTGQGGWPLTIIMTAYKHPFFAGTYLPRESRHGRLGMLDFIPRISEIWARSRADVDSSALNILGQLQEQVQRGNQSSSSSRLDAAVVRRAVETLSGRFDTAHGGFGDAPKFPSSHTLLLLLRQSRAEGGAVREDMVSRTLEAMRMGGLYDHVGYGFHRYATDAGWLLPHFEKMLYDQAMLAWAYVEGWQCTGKPLFRRTAEEIFTYVLRDMTDSGGAFRSAEDADSLTDSGAHEEGWFYTFTLQEVRSLPEDLASLAERIFAVSEQGNFADEASGNRTGRNILHLTRPVEEWARTEECTVEELWLKLEAVRANLFALRELRTRPHLDDKVLTDWNGLMISALARGARAFDAPHYAEAAAHAALFLLGTMRDEQGRLLHRYRDGEAAIPAHLDDYAFFIHGLIDLYQATFDPRWLTEALRLQEEQEIYFAQGGGGYYLTATDAELLPVRPMDAMDGALPSGNSISLLNLLRLARLLGRPDMERRADEVARAFAQSVRHMPSAFCMFLCGVDFIESTGRNVIIVGYPDTPVSETMLRTVQKPFAPDTTVVFCNADAPDMLAELSPFTAHLRMKDGLTTAYVCENYSCSQPITDSAVLQRRMLGREEDDAPAQAI